MGRKIGQNFQARLQHNFKISFHPVEFKQKEGEA